MNKTIYAMLCLLSLSACNMKAEPNVQNFMKGMNVYMEKHGDFCLGKTEWPIDVTQRDMDAHARDALQMPVFEKLGLTKSSVATVDVKNEDTGATSQIKVKRYELTDEGKKFYLTKSMDRKKSSGDVQHIQGDFCAAKLSLDKVVGWDPVKKEGDKQKTVVTYTYKIDAAPWTGDADVQKVFPVVAYIVNGAGKVQLKEAFVLTPDGWQATDL